MDQTTASAGMAARIFTRQFSGRRLAAGLRWAPGLVELLIVVGVAIILSKAAYNVFAPLPTPKTLPVGAPPPVSAAEPASLDVVPFRTAALDPEAPALVETDDVASGNYQETSLDLKLHGVFTIGAKPSAYIQTPDGQQNIFYPGDDIWDGARLIRVASDHVVISVNSVRETLTLINRDRSAQAAPAPRRAAATEETKKPRPITKPKVVNPGITGIGDVAYFSVSLENGKQRLIVKPGPNRARFDAAGLAAGDKIIEVNGRELSDNIVREVKALKSVAEMPSVSLIIERDGEKIPVTVKLSDTATGGEDDE